MGVQSPGVVITITAALCTLNLVALALRFLVRRRLRQNVKVDDWCVSVSMVSRIPDKTSCSILSGSLADEFLGLFRCWYWDCAFAYL